MRERVLNPTHVLHVAVLTLFPEMFPGPLQHSLAGKAAEDKIWRLDVMNLRDFATDKHKTVDDTPFGGGPGMVMRADVIDAAIQNLRARAEYRDAPVVYFTPRGKTLDQSVAKKLAQRHSVIMLCGRYEGIDQRVIDQHNMVEISMGDFVLSGGELPALMTLDAVIRLLPGVLGASETLSEESFENNLLEYPHYTRPAEWNGIKVPDVLLSGHHQKITDWRKAQSESITRERRKDLWDRYQQVSAAGGAKS